MEPNSAKATKVYDMCSFVGLKKEVASYILRQTANDYMVNCSIDSFLTDKYYVKRYMAEKYYERNYEPTNTNDELQHMGFTSASACHICQILEAHPISKHQPSLYWAELHVETMLYKFYDL